MNTIRNQAIAKIRNLFFFSRIVKRISLFLIFIIVVVIIFKTLADAYYFKSYNPSIPLLPEVFEKEEVGNGIREKISFQATQGSRIPALFHYPRNTTNKIPCLVLLYGIGQKMNFLDQIAESYVNSGYAIICYEQLGQGERKPKEKQGFITKFMSLRKRASLTVTEAMRVLDYLATRPEIDADSCYLLGISFGAIVGTSAMALEPRFKAGILMWGGGNFRLIFTHSKMAQKKLKSYQKLLINWGTSYLKPADPILRIHLIAPRPLLFQNALQDEIIPKIATEAYYNRAQKPKQILWYECGHEKDLTNEMILQIIADQITWLKSIGEIPSNAVNTI